MVDSLESLGFAPFGVIVAICFFIGFVIKHTSKSDKVTAAIPAIMVVCGAGLGVAMYFSSPEFAATAGEFWWALAIGGVSGVAATGIHQIFKGSSAVFGNTTSESGNTVEADVVEVDDSGSAEDVKPEPDTYTGPQVINNAVSNDDNPNDDSGITIDEVDPELASPRTPEGFVDIPISEVDPSKPTPEQLYSSPEEYVNAQGGE